MTELVEHIEIEVYHTLVAGNSKNDPLVNFISITDQDLKTIECVIGCVPQTGEIEMEHYPNVVKAIHHALYFPLLDWLDRKYGIDVRLAVPTRHYFVPGGVRTFVAVEDWEKIERFYQKVEGANQ